MTRIAFAAFAALLAASALAAPAPAIAPGGPLVGTIRDARTGATLTSDALADRIAAADVVLLGERHDNPDHHALQAWAIAEAAEDAVDGRLVLEMVRGNEDAPLADARPRDVPNLGEALRWEARGWPDYGMYAPILSVALEAGWEAVGGDAARAELADPLGAGDAERARLGLDRPLPAAAAARMERAIVEGHCDLLPAEAVPAFVAAQRLRDARMADALLEAAGRPAVLIAGAGHVGAEGVPFYLDARAPGRDVLSIAFVEAPADARDPAALMETFGDAAAAYDVVWFTAPVERGDVCAALRERFGAGGHGG
ncbi:ChaN family lipoprotein [Salinarimonas sp.]|uniref:ChaN family lipoprotein n=1 Tax=Salinarimonas sp. TaxID=2766526 RepID=UPI0032D95E6A